MGEVESDQKEINYLDSAVILRVPVTNTNTLLIVMYFVNLYFLFKNLKKCENVPGPYIWIR